MTCEYRNPNDVTAAAAASRGNMAIRAEGCAFDGMVIRDCVAPDSGAQRDELRPGKNPVVSHSSFEFSEKGSGGLAPQGSEQRTLPLPSPAAETPKAHG